MIISHHKKFIFLANGKTGTTALEDALQAYHDEPNLRCSAERLFNVKHVPAPVVRELLGEGRWSQYFKFGFVRHPANRFLSVWRHIGRARHLRLRKVARHPRSTLQYWLMSQRLDIGPMPEVVEAEHIRALVAAHSGTRLRLDCVTNFQYPVFYDSAGERCVDFVGRYETMASDLELIAERIGVDLPPLERRNEGIGRRKGITFSPQAAALLQEIYAEDFRRFDYRFEDYVPE